MITTPVFAGEPVRNWIDVTPQGVLAANCTACVTVLCTTVKVYNKTGQEKYYSSSYNHVQGQIATGTYPSFFGGVGVYSCFYEAERGICEYQYMPTTPFYNKNIPQIALSHYDDVKVKVKLSRSYDEVYNELLLGNPSGIAIRYNLTIQNKTDNYNPNFGGFHALAILDISPAVDSNGDNYLICFNPWGGNAVYDVSPSSIQLMINSVDGYAMTITDAFVKE